MNVVITGASSGIGLELSRRYTKIASRIYLLARNEEALNSFKNSYESEYLQIVVKVVDVTDFEALRTVSKEICAECEKIDLVVANAGVSSEHKAALYDFWDFKKIIDTNLLSVVAMFDIFALKMASSGGGKLVAISSLASFVAFPTTAAYSASKRAVNSFMDSMRLLLAPKNIKVINIQPGFIKTPLTDKNNFKMPFLMELDYAADKIFNAIEKNKREYAFPFLFALGAKNLSRLPASIRDKIVRVVVGYEKQPRSRT